MANQSTGVFYVETALDQSGEPSGEFRLVKNGCTYAHAKARSTLCALRDLLNAPRCLEGQTVEHQWSDQCGVVQAVMYGKHEGTRCVVALVRLANDTLCTWMADDLKVVTLDQAQSTESEVAP